MTLSGTAFTLKGRAVTRHVEREPFPPLAVPSLCPGVVPWSSQGAAFTPPFGQTRSVAVAGLVPPEAPFGGLLVELNLFGLAASADVLWST